MLRRTLDEFLAASWPQNGYVTYPGFDELYVRKGDIGVILDNTPYYCRRVITLASLTATKPGSGAFTTLVNELVGRGFAVYIECAHVARFRGKLSRMGFIRVDGISPNFLYNQKGHLERFQE